MKTVLEHHLHRATRILRSNNEEAQAFTIATSGGTLPETLAEYPIKQVRPVQLGDGEVCDGAEILPPTFVSAQHLPGCVATDGCLCPAR